MKILVAIFLILGCTVLNAQTFESLVVEGNKFYDEGKYEASAKAFQKALEINSENVNLNYNAACSFALSGDTIFSIKYLYEAAKLGWRDVNHLKSDTDLASLHQVSKWNTIVSLVEKNKNDYEKDLDIPLKKQLEALHIKDQTLRQLYVEAENKFGRGSNEMNFFWQKVNEQDSLNQLEVVSLLEEHGWLGKNVVGEKGNAALWLVVQHAHISFQEKYLPLLRESVAKGESRGNHLALLEDRVNMHNNRPQIYGSQIIRDEKTGQNIFYEIFEPEYVNKRRAEVGLGPIEAYAKRMGVEWNIEQKD